MMQGQIFRRKLENKGMVVRYFNEVEPKIKLLGLVELEHAHAKDMFKSK